MFPLNTSSLFTKYLLIVFLILTSLTCPAQNKQSNKLATSYSEKIYLQTDRTVYSAGNKIWFKAIVTKASNHKATELSNVLYVELISPEKQLVENQIIKLQKGIGQGVIQIDKKSASGTYLLRAYTNWNRNFGNEFFFRIPIQVFEHNRDLEKSISNLCIVSGPDNENYLEATLNPVLIDSLHKNKLSVILNIDGRNDTLRLKKEGKDFKLKYPINGECSIASLKMITSNKKQFEKTFVINAEGLDLQFFPESGELVQGLSSRVAFKATDPEGRGKAVRGEILDAKGHLVTSFCSNTLGMGSFQIEHADSAKKYYARLYSESGSLQERVFVLPEVAGAGSILSLSCDQKTITLTARSNYLKDKDININISCRGVSKYVLNSSMKDNELTLQMEKSILPEGILAFTLLDENNQTIAERLFFNFRPENRIKIETLSDKEHYKKRDLTKLKFSTLDSMGKAQSCNLSIMVINEKQLGQMQDLRQNILSYFLLSSELKGEIESPGYYFQNDSCKLDELDALLLSQGWRKYYYSKPPVEIIYMPEESLTVSGCAWPVIQGRESALQLTLMTFGNTYNIYSQKTDSTGRFLFKLEDEFGENMKVLFQSRSWKGKFANADIIIDENKVPVEYDFSGGIKRPDTIYRYYIKKEIERKKIIEALPVLSEGIELEEVTITGYKMTPNRKIVQEKYGKPEIVIEGEDLRQKEEKWSFGLYSILMFNYPDKIGIRKTPDGSLYAEVIGADMTLVVIDGKPVQYYNYPLIPYISPGEIKSFEVIECAKNFERLYIETTGVPPPRSIICGGVISIHTFGEKGIYGVEKPKGITISSVPVFANRVEFYAPKYENTEQKNSPFPDIRALIHWQPSLQTDQQGNAELEYFNSDNAGETAVIIEAISANGEIGYKKTTYPVEGIEQEIMLLW